MLRTKQVKLPLAMIRGLIGSRRLVLAILVLAQMVPAPAAAQRAADPSERSARGPNRGLADVEVSLAPGQRAALGSQDLPELYRVYEGPFISNESVGAGNVRVGLVWDRTHYTAIYADADHGVAWVLDVADEGARVGEADLLVLPQWVNVDNGRNTDRQVPGPSWFRSRARRVGEELLLHWTAGKSPWSGVRQPHDADASHSAAGLAKIDLRSGSVQMESLPVEREDTSGQTPVDELPQPVRDLARRERWQFAHLVGARVYGQVRETEPRGRVVYVIQAVDLSTARPLWQRPIGEVLLRSLPP